MISTTIPRAPEVPTMPVPAESEPDATPTVDSTVDMTVEDQIRRFVDGDHRRVVATVSLWAGSFDDASEAVTDALGSAWEQLDRGKPIDNLAAWVTSVAMNRVRSRHRRRATARRNRHLIAVVDKAADTTAGSATHLDLQRALAQLTERQRTITALHYGLDRSVAEIATDLGVAPGTVKATLHQTRQRLVDLLDDPDPGGSQ